MITKKVCCPVCNLFFNNNYCLSNHIFNRGNSKFLNRAHKKYWIEKKLKDKEAHKRDAMIKTYEKRCIRCKKLFTVNFDNRLKKRCEICEKKYPRRIKIKKKEYSTKNVSCRDCSKIITVRLFSNNEVCNDCRNKRKEEKKKSKLKKPIISFCNRCGKLIVKHKKYLRDKGSRRVCDDCKNDNEWFKKHNKYSDVIELLSTTDLTRHEIVTSLDLSHDFVKEAAIDRFGENWYENRLKKINENAKLRQSKSKKLFFDKLRLNRRRFKRFFDKRNHAMNPSSLERKFVQDISNLSNFIETNKWSTIKINGVYQHREIDVKVKLVKRKFAIFIDGEAFHGKNAKPCFKGPTIEQDCSIASAFAEKGYFSIRYSETEVKSNWAMNHFLCLYKNFRNDEPTFYYRNWMTNEEIVKYT